MKLIIAAALVALCAYAKDLNWQQGKVIEISSERFGVGNQSKLSTVLGGGAGHPTLDKGITYTIKAGKFTYIAAEMSMAHHRLKEERLNVNDPVKFALKGETKLVMVGNDGKEHTLELLKRTESDMPNGDTPLAEPK